MVQASFTCTIYISVKFTLTDRMVSEADLSIKRYIIIDTMVRAHLYQASASTLRPLCDEASDSALIEINGDT